MEFIAKSQASKKALNVFKLSLNLPVNILVYGPCCVGKKLLVKTANLQSFFATELDNYTNIQLEQLKNLDKIIVYNLEKVSNPNNFLLKLKDLKIIATTEDKDKNYFNNFSVKINILPLSKRPEDLEELIKIYKNEVKDIFDVIDFEVKIDLSQNGKSLKRSIFNSILYKSLDTNDIELIIYNYLLKKIRQGASYRELTDFYEKILLKASQEIYSSQLRISQELKINRITLRKKLQQHNL